MTPPRLRNLKVGDKLYYIQVDFALPLRSPEHVYVVVEVKVWALLKRKDSVRVEKEGSPRPFDLYKNALGRTPRDAYLCKRVTHHSLVEELDSWWRRRSGCVLPELAEDDGLEVTE